MNINDDNLNNNDLSLFSLEIIINYIKLNNNEKCLLPCVAFRLLDYPTIGINLLNESDEIDLKRQFSYENDITQLSNDQLCRLPCFKQLLDPIHQRFIFRKGKSCLFLSQIKSLKDHLKIVPLYFIIIDTFAKSSKLTGSSQINLSNLIDETCINNNNNKESIFTTVPIRDLMGNEIGHLSFVCRLCCFGSSMLPHIDITNEIMASKKIDLNVNYLKQNDLTSFQTVEKVLNQLKNKRTHNIITVN
jgi:hypothetical protein